LYWTQRGRFRKQCPVATQRGAAAHKWFVTCRHLRYRRVRDVVKAFPASEAHAKQMGTSRTACGLDASTWPKLWDLRFSPTNDTTCEGCLAVLAGDSGRREPCLQCWGTSP